MKATFMRTVSTLAATGALALGSIAATAPADAAPIRVRITAHPSDRTVDSGESFRVHGRFTLNGEPAGGRQVKIQSLRNGEWQSLTGSRLRTGSLGKYRVRIRLYTEGNRVLRAVGVGPTRNGYKRFVVQVG